MKNRKRGATANGRSAPASASGPENIGPSISAKGLDLR